jgi:hypothetical protein
VDRDRQRADRGRRVRRGQGGARRDPAVELRGDQPAHLHRHLGGAVDADHRDRRPPDDAPGPGPPDAGAQRGQRAARDRRVAAAGALAAAGDHRDLLPPEHRGRGAGVGLLVDRQRALRRADRQAPHRPHRHGRDRRRHRGRRDRRAHRGVPAARSDPAGAGRAAADRGGRAVPLRARRARAAGRGRARRAVGRAARGDPVAPAPQRRRDRRPRRGRRRRPRLRLQGRAGARRRQGRAAARAVGLLHDHRGGDGGDPDRGVRPGGGAAGRAAQRRDPADHGDRVRRDGARGAGRAGVGGGPRRRGGDAQLGLSRRLRAALRAAGRGAQAAHQGRARRRRRSHRRSAGRAAGGGAGLPAGVAARRPADRHRRDRRDRRRGRAAPAAQLHRGARGQPAVAPPRPSWSRRPSRGSR